MQTITVEGIKRYQELRRKWPRTQQEEAELLRLHVEANATYGTNDYDKPIVIDTLPKIFEKED